MIFLSVDFGTSSVKAAVIGKNECVLATYKCCYTLCTTCDEHAELDALEVLAAFESIAKDAFSAYPMIGGICFDAFAPSVLLMNETGQPLTPIITHMDRRSRSECSDIMMKIPDFLDVTGILPYPGGVSITSLLWLKRYNKPVVDKAFRFGHLTTLIYHSLTGRWAMDGVNASMTGLFRTFEGGWATQILHAAEIPASLCPDITEPWDPPVALTAQAADRIGAHHPVQVWMGTQDVSAAQLGAGNHTDGDLLITSGSSEMLSLLCKNPKPDAAYYTRRSAISGLWQVFAIGIGGFALEWFRKAFCREMTEQVFYEEYLPGVLSKKQKPAVSFAPYLAGDRHCLDIRRGGFSELTLATSREDMFAAVLYGIQEPLRQILDQWRAKEFTIHHDVKITGNLVQSEAYLALKKQFYPDYELHHVEGSPLVGNVRLALDTMKKE